MGTYILRRLILNIFVLWLVASMVFLSIRVLPGNYATQQFAGLNLGAVTPEAIASAERTLGLDKSYPEQYVVFMGDLLTLDLGESFRTKRSTWSELGKAMPYSLELGFLIVLVGFSVAIPVGVVSAVKQDQIPDYVLRGLAITALAAPVFWTAAIAVIFVLKWDLIRIDVIGQPHLWTDPWGALQWYMIPMFAGGFASTATTMRLLRSELLEVLRQDYVRTARAKGLTERTVIMRHRDAQRPPAGVDCDGADVRDADQLADRARADVQHPGRRPDAVPLDLPPRLPALPGPGDRHHLCDRDDEPGG